MKINKYFLGLAVILLGTLTSCETDVKGDVIYTPMGQNISFETATPSTVTTSQTSLTIPVRIIRSLTSGSYTANFTAEASDEGIFTSPTSVTFNEGQGVVEIEVTASNLEKGKDYTYTLTLSPVDVATADTITKKQNISTIISIHSDYTWKSLGKGHYSSPDFWEEEMDVVIDQAEGTNIYRIRDLFEKGINVQFSIGADNMVTVPEQVAWHHSSYGAASLMGYLYEDDSCIAGPYDPATKQATLTMVHFVSAGSFGAYTDVLTMP